jgi:hypothetical protein
LASALAPVLYIFSRKLPGENLFSPKQIFSLKLSQTYLLKSHVIKLLSQNSPFVSHVADKFCLFCNELKEKSTFFNFRINVWQDLFLIVHNNLVTITSA